jgi:ribonuclease R
VIPEDGSDDVFVASSQLKDAYDGDQVVARIERRRRGRNPEGTIVRVLERARSKVVGVYHRSGRYSYLAPLENALHRDVFIPPKAGGEAGDGFIVVARIVDWGSDHHDPVGEVVEILGRPGEPGVDVLAIIHSHELPAEFRRDALDEAEKLRAEFDAPTALAGRTDFRGTLTFTIDPADAKDHDDALSIERLASDRWRVGVHIADVSHFVREGSRIDQEARDRGTSVYLVDRVLPMLPEPLSGDLCSLKPDEDRLTLSACLELNSKAELSSVAFTGAVIRSRYALAYEEAQEIIDGERAADKDLRESLRMLRDLALRLRDRRQARGGLDFDLPEARVIVNSAGEPTTVQRILRLDTHRLIEEFMILTNESVARAVESRGAPFIYRVHEAPDPDRLERLREFIAGLGLKLARDADRTPRALQRLLATVEGRPEEPVVSTLVLRSMKQARYSAEQAGHFGLGSRAYSHFTSPIRRYPDLVAHRIVRLALLEKREVPEELAGQLGAMARHSSAKERQAMEAERESVELKKMEYLEGHLGDVFDGTISGVTSYGMFVLLDDVLAEGLVHVSQLEDDYYHFLEEQYALVGELKRRRFRLGDRVRVQAIKVNRELRELDLGLYE